MEKKETLSENYNPFEHRNVEKPNSDIRSLANLIKSSLGSGLLAMPLAFSNAGWGLGIIGTIIISIVCGHCIHIFVNTSRRCCIQERKPALNYAQTCKAVFANGPKAFRPYASAAQVFSEFALFFTYIGVCCIFTILTAASLKQLCDRYVTTTNLSVEYYCLILLVPFCLLCQIRHLNWLAPFSLLANILLVATFAICLYYIFRGKLDVSDKRIIGHPERFPAFLSAVIFAMEGIGVVMPVENAMKKPHHFLGCVSVLVVATTTITILYTTLGLCGYLRYGDTAQGSITLNLPIDDWPAICAKVFITVSIFLTYPLHFFVFLDVFTRYTEPYIKMQYRSITQVVARTLFVCFCAGVGIAIPMLEQIINVVGALFYSTLGLIIPAVIDTVSQSDDLGKFKWILWKNILIAIFGVCCLVSGCIVSISDIVVLLHRKIE